MNEKDILMDILENLKFISVNMTYALNEASNEYLYDKYFKMFKDVNRSTKEVFNLINSKGFYPLEKEENSKIKDAYDMLWQELPDR